MIRNKIVQALDAKFRADLMDAKAKLEVYLENPAGIGEHPQITEEAAKCVTEIVEAQTFYLAEECHQQFLKKRV